MNIAEVISFENRIPSTAFPSMTLESQADVDAYVERVRTYLNAMLKDCDGIKLNEGEYHEQKCDKEICCLGANGID